MRTESDAQGGLAVVDWQSQKVYVAKARAWVSSTAKRLHVEESEIIRAIRTGLFPDSIDECGSGLAFLTLTAGRSIKSIVRFSKYLDADQKGRERRERREQRRAA